jgi:hypothetical protein
MKRGASSFIAVQLITGETNMTQHTLARALLLSLALFSIAACKKENASARNDAKTPSSSEAAAPGGPEITAKDEKFSITMPEGFDTPKRSVEPLETDAGKIDMISYLTSNERGACMVMYGSFPESVFEGKTTEKILDDARDSAMAKMGAKLDKQEDFKVDGYPARSCYYSGSAQGTPFLSRFDYILVKPALYQVAFVGTSKEEVDKPDVQGYFKSFKLMK